nr:LOW QUALITY PROTEIN: uncharacterized protein LOC121121113 [Lepeophtheirus salmonis]
MSTSWLPRERLFALEQWASHLQSPSIQSWSSDSYDGFVCILAKGTRILLGRYPALIERLSWFQVPNLQLEAAVFSPQSDFLLFLSRDGTLHLTMTQSLMPFSSSCKQELHRKEWIPRDGESLFAIHPRWSSPPTYAKSLLWWNYGDFVSAALIGTQDGFLIVVDLVSTLEMGRVSFSKCAIVCLDVIWDKAMDCFYVIVTDSLQKQWRLLLEQRSSGYCWPRLEEGKSSTPPPAPVSCESPRPQLPSLKNSNSIDDLSTPPRSRIASGIKNMSVGSLSSLRKKIFQGKDLFVRRGGSSYISKSSPNRNTSRPESLSAKMGDAFISVQGKDTPDYRILASVHSSSAVLTVHNHDLEVIPGKAYKLPRNAKKVLIMSRVILASGCGSNFSTSCFDDDDESNDEEDEKKIDEHNGEVLHIISSAQAEFQTDPSRSIRGDSLVQSFHLASGEEVLGFHVIKKEHEAECDVLNHESPSQFDNFNSEVKHRLESLTQQESIRRLFQNVLVFTNKGIYLLTLKRDPISSFLELSMRGEMVLAERVASAFVIDSKSLLELAGDIRLKDNDCTGAVNLYRTASMKHLKAVLKFSYSGHIAELLNYLSSLFKTPNVDVTVNERNHLSNLALMAYFQQVLTKITPSTKFDFRNEIKGFINSNRHFDETLAIRLAADTKEWDLLSYFSRTRGLRHEAVGAIIKVIQNLIGEYHSNEIGKERLKLISKSLQDMPSVERNSLLSCLLDPLNLECCASTINGINLIKILSGSLPLLEEEGLQAVALMSAPENPAFLPFFQHEDISYASSFLNLFVTSLLLLIKKRQVHTTFNPILTEISNNKAGDKDRRSQKVNKCRVNILAAGGNHVLLIRKIGSRYSLFSWGSTTKGALGRGSYSENFETIKEVPYFRENNINVISVAAGTYHSLALTEFGVYSWGLSKYGQLGHGNCCDQKRPALIKSLTHKHIVDISAGRYHSLALDSEGGVWSWGFGVHGQLGHDDIEDVLIPQRVLSLRKVKISQIAAGYTHSVCLSSKGEVFSFGNNLFGQLGNGLTKKSNVPIKTDISICRDGEYIKCINSGFFHNLALTNHGRVLTWGSNPQIIRLETQSKKRLLLQNLRNSRMATSSSKEATVIQNNVNDEPTSISNIKDIKKQQILPVNINNKSDSGALAPICVQNTEAKKWKLQIQQKSLLQKDEMPHLRPLALNLENVDGNIVKLSGGNQHSMILTDKGLLYGFGLNQQGQLGNDSRKDSKTLTQTKELSNNRLVGMVCGMDYTISMSHNGTLFGWGNNSCGTLRKPPIINNRSFKDKLILMPTRRIRLNHPSPNSWDIPKPVLGTQPPSSQDCVNKPVHFQFSDFSKFVSVEFPSAPPKKSYDIRSCTDVPLYLHSTLENFYSFLDTKTLIKKCLISENPQAASKISLLDGNMLQAFEFTLQSIIKSHPSGIHTSSEAVFGAFKYYLTQSASRSASILSTSGGGAETQNREIDMEEDEDRSKAERRNLFERLVACWQDQKWSFVHLEKLIIENASPTMLQILVITLFCPSNERRTDKGPVINQDSGPKLVDLFTPEFCLKIGDIFVNDLKEQDEYWHNEREFRKWLMTQKPNKMDSLANVRKT